MAMVAVVVAVESCPSLLRAPYTCRCSWFHTSTWQIMPFPRLLPCSYEQAFFLVRICLVGRPHVQPSPPKLLVHHPHLPPPLPPQPHLRSLKAHPVLPRRRRGRSAGGRRRRRLAYPRRVGRARNGQPKAIAAAPGARAGGGGDRPLGVRNRRGGAGLAVRRQAAERGGGGAGRGGGRQL